MKTDISSLNEPQGVASERHIPELDGIRGLAALAVVQYHLALYTREHSHGLTAKALSACLFGNFGVDVFFALSGFLITSILLLRQSEKHYYRNFYGRRVLRLVPPYLIILLLVALLIPHSGKFLLLSIVYLANLSALFHVQAMYGPLWTLSLEEQFYFVWPWVVKFASRKKLLTISLLICVVSPCIRLYEAYHGGFNEFLSWYRLDGLAWGAVLAAVNFSSQKSNRGRDILLAGTSLGGLLLAGAGLICYGRFGKYQAFSLFYSAAPMLTVALITAILQHPSRLWAPFRSKFLRFFGDISYWLYLIHFLVLYEATLLLEHRYPGVVKQGGIVLWLVVATVVFSVSILSGILVRRWIELPALRRKIYFS